MLQSHIVMELWIRLLDPWRWGW